MNNDLISREALREDFYELEIHGTMAVKAVLPIIEERIDNLPAVDAVEVVRCGQCLWRKEYDELGEQIWCMNPSMDCANLLRMDDFCSYGERKE